MSAVIRAYGAEFDVDAFLVGCALPICAVKRRGEPVFAASQPNGRRHDRSGIHVPASNADFDEFSRQVSEAIKFLHANRDQILRLCSFPGVDGVTLDFGIARRDVLAQFDHLPAELIQIAGSLRLGIELSQYPVQENSE
jgi:hypothetical protein